jgi:PAS domain S-box-containing protein
MEREIRILILEDVPTDAELAERELRKAGIPFTARRADSKEAFLDGLRDFRPDAILADYALPRFNALEALRVARDERPDTPFILVTGSQGEETAVALIREGADDYILKSSLKRLPTALLNALKRKESERAHRRLISILEATTDFVGMTDAEGRAVYLNQGGRRMIGVGEDESIQGFSVAEGHPAWARPLFHEALLTAVRDGVWQGETALLRRDGREIPVSQVIMAHKASDGTVEFFSSVARDITEIKRAEESLRESERRYRSLVESVTNYIYTVRVEEGRAVETLHGPGCAAVTGYAEEEYKTDPQLWLRMVHEEDREAVTALSARLLSGEDVQPLEHRIIHKDGSIRWVRNTPVQRRDRAGRLVAYDGLVVDITEEKKLEEQLRHSQKMEAIGRLAGGIAHDFNNILTGIIGYGNLLKRKIEKGAPPEDEVDQVLDLAGKAAHLTQGLLAFSRRQAIWPKPVNLNDLVARVERLLARIIGEDIELRIGLAEGVLVALADSGSIEQVLMNLAANARDAMPRGGRLTIETDRAVLDGDFVRMHGYGQPGMYALVEVSDTGVGMDEKTRRRIFEPFFTTKEVGKGTGLGLSMCYGIVKQHNGYINVYSEPGRGTIFRIYLPLAAEEAEEPPPEEPEIQVGGTETVLLAEDDADVRKLTRAVLEEFGYRVVEAVDGEEAVRQYREHGEKIDLVILDVIMPRKDGRAAYEEIKRIRPDAKALFLSGYAAGHIRPEEVGGEGLRFLAKPISPRELLREVRRAIEE